MRATIIIILKACAILANFVAVLIQARTWYVLHERGDELASLCYAGIFLACFAGVVLTIEEDGKPK